MAQTASNVSAAKPRTGGAVWIADEGTTLPTDAVTALDNAFECLGYVSEDGLTNSNTPNTEEIHAWGGDPVLTLYNAKDDTFKYNLIEVLAVAVLKSVYGPENVSGTLETGIVVKANNKELPNKAYVFEMIMRDGALKRIVLPSASITALEDITYSDSSAIGYGVTLSAHADETGNTHYEYIKKATVANG